MTSEQVAMPTSRLKRISSEPDAHLLEDCWLLEVMPPTWAWAYRKLLNTGEAEPRRTDRLA